MSSAIAQRSGRLTLRSATTTVAAPTTAPASTDPNYIPDSWKAGIGKVRGTLLTIKGSDGSVDLTGPVCVDVYIPNVGWSIVATLDEGANINIGDGENAPSRSWRLSDLAAVGTAIQVHAAAIAGGSWTVYADPIEVEGAD